MHPTTVFSLLALVLADKAWSHRHAPAPETTGKSEAIPVTASDPWDMDDLGPVSFRTERPETAILDIDTLEASTTTLTGMGSTTMTMTTTAPVQVESVIIYESSSTTTTTVPSSDEPSSTTSTDTPILTSSTTITSAPTGDALTTVDDLTRGPNTVQLPMSSAAPVIVINVPSDSYSSGYTTETIWSSVWEPRNIAVNTVTRSAAFYVPASSSKPSETPAPTGKSSGASTARSGAGVIVMTGVGALAACFMML
ncbi:hypothetical protein GE21DRAFT_8405 [Neurospora crassa]|uniref:Uncharacterized protein n=1 Tax=Neurospora crassa (strain ATCC 24698 / 74-OR23-1A / CBS 708.71 / DSM 1257 / FGSC 987) TaxID=367110 RepID=Q7S1B4_NEUCR|nr:hypothetical protein NCU09851 [Neurospora crassa OR74A]EAA29139.1 hypothetical protein NCU09851 [Neurospora crassa OR74A]KHE82035.1 hypothetical protein GE21DRAFT_8405 [Neurospora crassa]|eukprot:XP_958375.1 hypothetical protein NCU09851 [Neurospora crassa OR74A]